MATKKKQEGFRRGAGRVRTQEEAMKAPGAKEAVRKANKQKIEPPKKATHSGTRAKQAVSLRKAATGPLVVGALAEQLADKGGDYINKKLKERGAAKREAANVVGNRAMSKINIPASSDTKKNTKASPAPKNKSALLKKKGTSSKKSATRGEFDKSFAAARKSGKKEFTFRGKKYNTKVK